jgi:lipid-A-disaccharide synthase
MIRKACDRVLCLLPFEADFLARHRIDGWFVGHPLADMIGAEVDGAAARSKLGLDAGPVVAILPGSRRGEVTRIGPDFIRAAREIMQRCPDVTFVVPAATPALRRLIESQFTEFAPACEPLIVDGRAHDALAACDVALLASGTVTLEAMLLKRPMVVAYKVAPLTYYAARLLRLIKVKYMSLPNLLADAPLVPEFLQDEASPAALAAAVITWLESPEKCEQLVARFGALHDRIRRSAGDRSAAAVLELAGLDVAARPDSASHD